MTTLKVTVEDSSFLDDDERHQIETGRRHGPHQQRQPVLTFSSYTDLNRLVNPLNLELLETLTDANPKDSVELANLLGRDEKHVRRNLRELAKVGVVSFDTDSNSRLKHLKVLYDGFDIDIQLSGAD